MRSRFDFINQILIEELYDKRLPCLTSFREGLDHFGLIKLLHNNPDLWKTFFIDKDGSQSKPITAKDFLDLLKSEPKSDEEKQAYAHFNTFLGKHENLTGKNFYSIVIGELKSVTLNTVFFMNYFVAKT